MAELRDQRQGERLEHAAALRALQDQVYCTERAWGGGGEGRLSGYCAGRQGPRGPTSPGRGSCGCVLSFLAAGRSCFPVLDPLSLVVGWGQVSLQSADAQEQVEGLLTENNALRTSLAALEQVQDTWEPMLIPP